MSVMVKTISKNDLQANFLAVLQELEVTGQQLLVLENNTAVFQITPLPQKKNVQELFSQFQGKVAYAEDVDTPTAEQWTEL